MNNFIKDNWLKTFLIVIFIAYVLSLLGGKVTIINSIILIVIIFVLATMGVRDEDENRERILKNMRIPGLIVKQAEVKEEHKKKIVEMFFEKENITNNDIEKALGVSDATAERYLNELEKDGTIKQVGKTGRSVFYSKF